jgi:hypothetical protein
MKAQANYRRELWMLSFEEFQMLWMGFWERKGRGIDDYCLTREDPNGAWIMGNVECIPWHEHLKRSGRLKAEKKQNGNTSNQVHT